jgi:nucleoid-associated protein YgaU
MGLFEFVKDAGSRLFGIETEAQKEQKEQARAEALVQQVRALDLEVEDLQIELEEDVATVYGKTASQAEKEKVVLVVGNVKGVAKVDDRIEVVEPEPEAQFYTVKPGDSLSKIAKEYYGNAMKYPVIFEANRPMLKDPNKIYPGQVLRIPALD